VVNNAPSTIVFKKQMKSQICLFIIAIFQTVRSQITPKIVGTGQVCGGVAGIICQQGNRCVLPPTDKFIATLTGICRIEERKTIEIGKPCGNNLSPLQCAIGLKCVPVCRNQCGGMINPPGYCEPETFPTNP
jgi:hypothetical protein